MNPIQDKAIIERWLIFATVLIQLSSSLDNGEAALDWNPRNTLCDRLEEDALGMESGAISDIALQASSSYNEQSVGPSFARLNKDLSGGAWCPSPQLDLENSGSEWILVNLSAAFNPEDRFVITGIGTQGRFGNGHGVEFVEEYWIEYSRDKGGTWHKWKNRKGSHLLRGNTDTYTKMLNRLDLPIVGVDLIKLVPYSQHTRTVCLRFELYGCPYVDGPISYSMPDGVFGGRFGDLLDDSYDGTRNKNGYLTGGLGQLVDSIKGHENYKISAGYEWIGWKASNNTVEIQFEFPKANNFTSAEFYCHNLFKKSVEVFSSAKVYFSFDGLRWSKAPVEFEYMPDHVMETPRDVAIHLNHRVARYVKFSLRFASKWLLLSEIKFNSNPIYGDYNENIGDLESLEIAQEAVKPIYQTKQSNSLLIGGLALLSLFIVASLSVVLYRYWIQRKKTTSFYPVDVDPMDTTAKEATPVYCEPSVVNHWDCSGNQVQHEYAVPDVIYRNGVPTQSRLISNPLHDLKTFKSHSSETVDYDGKRLVIHYYSIPHT